MTYIENQTIDIIIDGQTFPIMLNGTVEEWRSTCSDPYYLDRVHQEQMSNTTEAANSFVKEFQKEVTKVVKKMLHY